jgi:hypothetical protein
MSRDERKQDEGRQGDEKNADRQHIDDQQDSMRHGYNKNDSDSDSGIVPLPPFPDPETQLRLLAQYNQDQRWEQERQEAIGRAYHVEHAGPRHGRRYHILTRAGYIWVGWNGTYYYPV